MNVSNYLFRFKKQEILRALRHFYMSSSQRSTERLNKISGHFLGDNFSFYPCSRIPSRSLCSNSMKQFGSERLVQSTELEAKDERSVATLLDNQPNESWSKETLKIYNELRKQVDESNGLWEIPKIMTYTEGQFRSFLSSIDKNGKRFFEWFPILNKTEQCYKGVCQLGPWTMGPRGYVHGGAIATVLDMITAGLANKVGYRSLTANLSVDFKNPVPVGSTVLAEAKIESVQGKKVYVNAEIKSSDRLQLYATAKTLMVVINSN